MLERIARNSTTLGKPAGPGSKPAVRLQLISAGEMARNRDFNKMTPQMWACFAATMLLTVYMFHNFSHSKVGLVAFHLFATTAHAASQHPRVLVSPRATRTVLVHAKRAAARINPISISD